MRRCTGRRCRTMSAALLGTRGQRTDRCRQAELSWKLRSTAPTHGADHTEPQKQVALMPPNNLVRHTLVLPRPSINVVRGMGNPEWRAWERSILGIMPRRLMGWVGRNGFACCL